MLLNLSWLVPGLPIIVAVLMTVLLVSFSRTMNRLTKPVSYLLILSVIFSEIIDFFLYKDGVSATILPFEGLKLFNINYKLFIDKESLFLSMIFGLVLLLVMIYSLAKLKRSKGYVRYFISLGFLSGFMYVFFFSGSVFHSLFDSFMTSLNL